mgnify:FL=1
MDILARAGVRAILNFAPKAINAPPEIKTRNVDLSVNMEVLSFYMANEESGDDE